MAGPSGPEIPAAAGSVATTSGATSAEQFVHRDRTLVERFQAFLHRYEVSSSLIVLMITLVAFSLIHGGKFLDAGNMSIVLQQVMFVGTLAIAQSLIILTAGIDLSVGVIGLLSMVVMGRLAFYEGLPPWLAIAIGIGVGGLCGFINGVLIVGFKLSPFIATLGTFAAFGALVLYVSDNQTIGSFELDEKTPFLKATGHAYDVGGFIITPGLLMMLALFGTRSNGPPGAGTSTPSAPTLRPPAWSASGPTACCCRSIPSPVLSAASPDGSSSDATVR
jgi:fructose transport system permease protein